MQQHAADFLNSRSDPSYVWQQQQRKFFAPEDGARSNHLGYWEGIHFPLPSLDFWHVQCLQGSEKQSSTTGPESQNALHMPSALHWWVFQHPCTGQQQKNWASHCQFGPNLVSSAIQLTSQGKPSLPSLCASSHVGFFVVVLGLFFKLVEQHQPNRGETEPFLTLNTLNLSNSRLYLKYHKKKRELCYPTNMHCVPWSGASPQARDPQHLRDQEHKGGCSATSHCLHNTDSQSYWGGKAPLGIAKSNPLPKSRVPQRRLLRAVSKWVLMISKKCSITCYNSNLCSVITIIIKRGLSLFLLFSFYFTSLCLMLIFFSNLFRSSHWLEIN